MFPGPDHIGDWIEEQSRTQMAQLHLVIELLNMHKAPEYHTKKGPVFIWPFKYQSGIWMNHFHASIGHYSSEW